MTMSKTSDILSPRKRSPRKQTRWPGRTTSDGIRKRNSNSNSQRKIAEQKTLQHFFKKQQEKSRMVESLHRNGTQKVPLIIEDSDDERESSTCDKVKPKFVKNLFSPSPSVKGNRGESSPEASQLPPATATSAIEQPVLEQGVVISPLKEADIDFHRDDTDDMMAELPEPVTEQKRQWTPVSDTFETLLEKVRKYELLGEDDLELFDRFEKMSKQAREICLRLYERKHKWISRAKINYKLDDIDGSLTEAVARDFLRDKSKLSDVPTLLNLLPVKDVVALGRKFCDLKTSTKGGAIEALLVHLNRKDVLFGQQRIRQSVLRSSQELLEQCFFVVPEFAEGLTRVLTLFSLGSHFDTFSAAIDRNDHGCCHLYSIGQYLRGSFTLPDHETEEILGQIFKSAEDFKLLCDARVRQFQLLRLVESNSYDEATIRFEQHFDWFVSRYSPDKFSEDASLPQFLHRFTFSYCLLKFFSIGAEIFERQKRYEEAVDLYCTLLSQTTFLLNRRGLCWNRLLLDVDAHLKKPRNALALAHIALQDSIPAQQKYDIFIRAERLCKRFRVRTTLPEFLTPVEAPVETISGHLMQRAIIGRRNVFASVDSGGERVVGPEAVAIEHYLNEGFTRGVHGETPAMLMLFSLLCWDIVFGEASEKEPETPRPQTTPLTKGSETEIMRRVFAVDIDCDEEEANGATKPKRKRGEKQKKDNAFPPPLTPLEHKSRYYGSVLFPEIDPLSRDGRLQRSVYCSEFQSGPLDIGYPEFYVNRKRAIHEHLELLSRISSEEIVRRSSAEYEKHSGTVNPFFNWEVLTKEEVETLLTCIPVDALVGVCRQLLTDFRFYRSGFPDIIMWNESNRTWKVIEVKGPGDTLSTKQRYWMNLLRSLGVNCVTCRVESVHSKRIRPAIDV